jgi:hypothetical protein
LRTDSAETGAKIPKEEQEMSDEQRKDAEDEVEGHVRSGHMNEEPRDEAEKDDDVEAHVRHANVRHSNVRHD